MAMLGCAGSKGSDDASAPETGIVEPTDGECQITWDGFAKGYVQTWCAPCHTEHLEGEERQGAPAGIDFNRWSQVHAMADRVEARSTGDSPDMPPAGGVDPIDVELFAEWLACGAQGADEPPTNCSQQESIAGDRQITSQAEADALCAEGNGVGGTLTVLAEVELPCLCEAGALSADATLTAPSLHTVQGDVELSGALEAPALVSVGGSLTVLPGLAGPMSLDELRDVGGSVVIEGSTRTSLAGLDAVDGDVRVSGELAGLDLTRLRTVGGELVVGPAPALAEIDGLRALREVGGSITLTHTALEHLDPLFLIVLSGVGGSVTITHNTHLKTIEGLSSVPSIPGDLTIADNPALTRFEALETLHTVTGNMEMRGLTWREFRGFDALRTVSGVVVVGPAPTLQSLVGLDHLQHAGGITVDRVGMPQFLFLPELLTVEGDVVLTTTSLVAIGGMDSLTTVGDELRIEQNAGLTSIVSFPVLESVGAITFENNLALHELGPISAVVHGDLTIRTNPALPTLDAEGFAQDLSAVEGDTIIEDNLP